MPPPPRNWFQSLSPYFPLIAVILQIPWAILLFLSQMGGQGNIHNDPNYYNSIIAACALPPIIGFLIGLYVLYHHYAARPIEWICLILGILICAISAFNTTRGLFH